MAGTGPLRADQAGALDAPAPPLLQRLLWGFARIFCFRAEAGALDALRETFWHVAGSVKMNPLWERLYAQVLQQLKAQFDQYIQAGYSQIQAAAQLSGAISANNDYLLNSFEAQRRADGRWQEPAAWWRSAVLNTARMGWFSSDRTIAEYAGEIWNVPIKR